MKTQLAMKMKASLEALIRQVTLAVTSLKALNVKMKIRIVRAWAWTWPWVW